MAVTFSSANQSVTAAASDIVKSALLEGAIIGAGEPLQAEDGAWGLEKLQRITDRFNARRDLVYGVQFSVFTLIANHAPHTIGPGADFKLPTAPVNIMGANFILNSGGSPVDTPIIVRDEAWWNAQPVKSLTSAIVTDVYYERGAGLGNLNFFPICTVASQVRLEIWQSLSQAITLATKLGMPQGYWDAIVTELAIALCPSYNRSVSADLRDNHSRAMRVITANNDKPPIISTCGSGLPNDGRGAGRPDYNFLTGLPE